MSDELTISVSLGFAKGTASELFRLIGETFDVSGTKCVKNFQTVGTTEEALQLGDVGTPGYILVVNRDATNFVSFRAATGGTNTVKLKAGEIAMFRFSTAAPYVIADSASCVIEYLLIED